MKFTIDWLKQHLDTKYNDEKIIDKLINAIIIIFYPIF